MLSKPKQITNQVRFSEKYTNSNDFKKPLFIYKNGLSFALLGGRAVVLDAQLKLHDYSIHANDSSEFEGIGKIKAENMKFSFYDFNVMDFDYNSLRNCWFLYEKIERFLTDFHKKNSLKI